MASAGGDSSSTAAVVSHDARRGGGTASDVTPGSCLGADVINDSWLCTEVTGAQCGRSLSGDAPGVLALEAHLVPLPPAVQAWRSLLDPRGF